MSIEVRGQITSKTSRLTPEGGFLNLLRAAAMIAVLVAFRYLGALSVYRASIGQLGFEALVGSYPSNAL